MGVPIQIAQIGVDYLGTVNTAISAVGSIAHGVGVGGAVGGLPGAIAGATLGAISGIGNTIASSMPQMQTGGANGSFMNMTLSTVLISHFFIPVDEDIHHKGRPLCAVKRINTLSGYVQCAEGDIDINGFDNERKIIKDYLTQGFFWE